MDDLANRERLYIAIADCIDESSRNILYHQFVSKFYPLAYNAITGSTHAEEIRKIKERF